ncbi:MAG: OsmC family protein [Armatimonadetes bacterium]|nr:OsmC family protein [Armatimonadota bacterium]
MNVTWKGDMAFEAVGDSGVNFTMDTYPEHGGNNTGPTPVEALMASLAACSAMDVISILKKKRQEVTGYRIEVSGDRNPPGEWPRPFKSFKVVHIVEGPNLDEAAVARAVELSDEKYCTVVSTLREQPEVVSEYRIEKP